jgi:hypothetical protein
VDKQIDIVRKVLERMGRAGDRSTLQAAFQGLSRSEKRSVNNELTKAGLENL